MENYSLDIRPQIEHEIFSIRHNGWEYYVTIDMLYRLPDNYHYHLKLTPSMLSSLIGTNIAIYSDMLYIIAYGDTDNSDTITWVHIERFDISGDHMVLDEQYFINLEVCLYIDYFYFTPDGVVAYCSREEESFLISRDNLENCEFILNPVEHRKAPTVYRFSDPGYKLRILAQLSDNEFAVSILDNVGRIIGAVISDETIHAKSVVILDISSMLLKFSD